jgi:hypothetical protein
MSAPDAMSQDDATPILDPRRVPRFAVRCLVRAETGELRFESATEDLGLRGCQLVAPARLARGTPIRLVLAFPSLAESLRVSGLVAWSGPHQPWRHGVAFAAAHLEASARWLTRLTTLHPELTAGPRAPAQLAPGAPLFLGEPPRFLLDFTSSELAVLRQVQAGVTVGELRRRLGAAWEPAARALFSLLARQAVLLEPDAAARLQAWEAPLGAGEPPAARPTPVARVKLRQAPPTGEG